MLFDVPEAYARELVATKKEGSAYRMVDGVVKGRLGNAAWFTNLDHAKRREKLILWRRYTPEQYPTYDNYHAINVNRTAEIPPGLRRRDGRADHVPRQTQSGAVRVAER